MRFTGIVSLALAGVLLSGCGPRPDEAKEVLVRHHFAGLGGVTSRPDLSKVSEVLALPESRAVLADVTGKLAMHLPVWFGAARLGTNDAGPLVSVVRSLLDAESYLEVRTAEGRVTGWALAARLDAGATTKAGAELRRVLGAAPTPKADEAFEIEVGAAKIPARFAAAGGWVLVGSGRGAFDGFRSALASGGRPGPVSTNAVLEVEADLAGLAKILQLREKPPGPVEQWPKLQVTVEPRNGRLRTAATMAFAQPLRLPMEPWRVPTNVVWEPLVGFTAVQGADTWISRLGLFADLGVTEWPKQIFLWSQAGKPWMQFFAAPIAAPTNLMAQVSLTLPVRAVTNMLWNGSMFALRITNQATRVQLRGLPFFEPFMEAQRLPDREQLFGGLFPQAASGGTPAPQGLIAQVAGRTNLVLYDWETTGRRLLVTNPPTVAGPRIATNDIGRLIQFTHLLQFVELMLSPNGLNLPSTASGGLRVPGSEWVEAAVPVLGDTVTEVTLAGPTQLNLVRQSASGFSAMELLYLLRWFENPGFPGWTDVPPPPPRARPAPAGANAAPASSPTAAPAAPGSAPVPARTPGKP